MSDHDAPDGIGNEHLHGPGGSGFYRWPLELILLGGLLAFGVTGFFGVYENRIGAGDVAKLSVHGPARIRSGEFFEMTFVVEARRPIRDVVLDVDERIWRDVTINTMIPQPADERYEQGVYRFRFGPLSPGARFQWKVDGQVNPRYPFGDHDGSITLADGKAALVAVDYSMEVLP